MPTEPSNPGAGRPSISRRALGQKVHALSGDLDVFSITQAWEGVRGLPDLPCADLVIDLSAVEDVDMSGLQLLLSLVNACRERGLPLSFRGLQDPILERFRLAGAEQLFEGRTQ